MGYNKCIYSYKEYLYGVLTKINKKACRLGPNHQTQREYKPHHSEGQDILNLLMHGTQLTPPEGSQPG